MESKHRFSVPILCNHQEADLIESYLDDKYGTAEAKSSHSKKSKYTSSSKLTKSSLFRLILKK